MWIVVTTKYTTLQYFFKRLFKKITVESFCIKYELADNNVCDTILSTYNTNKTLTSNVSSVVVLILIFQDFNRLSSKYYMFQIMNQELLYVPD